MGSIVEPMEVILLGDKVLKIDGFTVTMGVVAVAIPPGPVQLNVYVTLPVPIGVTTTDPLVGSFPLKVPPIVLDALAEQEVVLAEVQASLITWPKLMLAACVGAVNITVGRGAW